MGIERSIFVQVPQAMAIFFKDNKQFKIGSLEDKYEKEELEGISGCMEFLVRNNFAMFSKFPPIMKYFGQECEEQLVKPFPYDSLIIDSDESSRLIDTLKYLPSWQFSRFVQIRMFFAPNSVFLRQLGAILNEKDFFNTELVLNYNTDLDLNEYSDILVDFRFHISRIAIMDCPIVENKYPYLLKREQIG